MWTEETSIENSPARCYDKYVTCVVFYTCDISYNPQNISSEAASVRILICPTGRLNTEMAKHWFWVSVTIITEEGSILGISTCMGKYKNCALWTRIRELLDFPGGTVDKNPSASAGNMGLIPGLGRFHTLWSNKAHAPQLRKPASLKTMLGNKKTHCNEKPRAPQLESSPCSQKREKAHTQQQRPSATKKKRMFKKIIIK